MSFTQTTNQTVTTEETAFDAGIELLRQRNAKQVSSPVEDRFVTDDNGHTVDLEDENAVYGAIMGAF